MRYKPSRVYRGNSSLLCIFLTAGSDNGAVCSVAHSEFVLRVRERGDFSETKEMTTMLNGPAEIFSHKSHEPWQKRPDYFSGHAIHSFATRQNHRTRTGSLDFFLQAPFFHHACCHLRPSSLYFLWTFNFIQIGIILMKRSLYLYLEFSQTNVDQCSKWPGHLCTRKSCSSYWD